MTLIGGVVVPALDALSLKLKITVPNFKKKKGALPAEITEVQSTVWTASKTALKSLQTAIEEQGIFIEAKLNETFTEAEVAAIGERVQLPNNCDADDFEEIRARIRDKALEFASEKGPASSQRVKAQAQLVAK